MQRRPPRTTRTDTLFPDTTLFRSHRASVQYAGAWPRGVQVQRLCASRRAPVAPRDPGRNAPDHMDLAAQLTGEIIASSRWEPDPQERSEEHTSELQSLMRISYAVFCLKKKKK